MKDADLTLPGEIKIAMFNTPIIFAKNWTLVLKQWIKWCPVRYHSAIFSPDISEKVLEKWKFFDLRGMCKQFEWIPEKQRHG